MTKYINTETNAYPITEADIRAANPLTSFPQFLDKQLLNDLGYAVVFPSPQPEGTIEGLPNLTSKGHYEQTWIINK